MKTTALRGVNLGGWLVLEKWMTPTLFEGVDGEDEYSFMQVPGSKRRIEKHRQTFITEADFQWLATHGINAVRIPVGYWIFEGDYPYTPAIEYLDWAVAMAHKYNLQVLIDLHGAKGSQNGQHHSGRKGQHEWYRNRTYRQATLDVLEQLAERYYSDDCIWGIELLNEPRWGLVQWKLRRFYRQAYTRLLGVIRPGVHIVFSDAFTPWLLSGALIGRPNYPVAMDIHWYQFASIIQRWLPLKRYFSKLRRRASVIRRLQIRQPVIIGEWSVVLSGEVLAGRSPADEAVAFKQHADLQLQVYTNAAAWFYWTYKTEGRGIWHFRSLVEDGVIILE